MRLVFVLLFVASFCAHAQSYAPGGQQDFERGAIAAEQGNYAEAYCIWRPLADSGHAESQYRLGWLYAKGLGLAVNEAEAVRWWQKASNQEHVDSLFRLGWAYEHGEGVEQDMSQAIEYYLAAARQEHEDAVEILQLMLMRDNEGVSSGVADMLENNPEAIGTLSSISVARANIRNSAGKNGALITTLNKDDPVVVLGSRGDWLRIWIVARKQFGWIFKTLVSGQE